MLKQINVPKAKLYEEEKQILNMHSAHIWLLSSDRISFHLISLSFSSYHTIVHESAMWLSSSTLVRNSDLVNNKCQCTHISHASISTFLLFSNTYQMKVNFSFCVGLLSLFTIVYRKDLFCVIQEWLLLFCCGQILVHPLLLQCKTRRAIDKNLMH